MKYNASYFIALRYLLGRGKEGGRYLRGAALGIALSLVPIVVTLVVADGMIQGITERYLELGIGHVQIYPRKAGIEIASIAPVISNMEGVRGAWSEKQGLGILVGKKGKTGASIRAITPGFLQDEGTARYLRLISGEMNLQGEKDVLLGEELAHKAGVELGDTVRLMTVRSANGKTVPRISTFRVSGIVSSGYRELDALWFLVRYDVGTELLASRSFLSVKLDNPYKKVEDQALAFQDKLGIGYAVYTWKELQHAQFSSYASTRQLLLFIMALVVIVAAINVSSATSMLVVERRRDIAILKSFGVNAQKTSSIFVFGALLSGLVGSLLGLTIGLLLCNTNGLSVQALEGFFSSNEPALGWNCPKSTRSCLLFGKNTGSYRLDSDTCYRFSYDCVLSPSCLASRSEGWSLDTKRYTS
ncbi:hypothetical protein MASR2M78_00190 [Treponema sp.]